MATILIADDRPVDREFLVTLLGYAGHRLLEAADGADALSLVRAERPDLVITDILMPGVDGFTFVRQLRAEPEIAQTPVLLYTAAYNEADVRALAAACGIATVLNKPAEPEVILRVVDALLGTPSRPVPALSEEFDREHTRVLTDKLYNRSVELEASNRRLAALVELGQQLAVERDLRRLFHHFCEVAREIVGARAAAVGLLDEDGQTLRHYFTSCSGADDTGVRPEPRAGVLGSLLDERRPTRLHDLNGSAEMLGFPPDSPAIHSFLGVPILSKAHVHGWLYLVDKSDAAEFSADDERLAVTLAAQVAVAYENALREDEIQRRTAELEREVGVRRGVEEELRQRVEQLAEADRRKDEFLAMLAHELRNPLAPLRNALHILRMRGTDARTLEQVREMMDRQVQHLARLLDDLLDVSRIARGKIALHRERVDLARLVRVNVEDHTGVFEAAGLSVCLEAPEVPVWVEGDFTRLNQILDNLLENAAKFTERGGRIAIQLDAGGGGQRAVLTIRDSGIGIDPAMLPSVFDVFTQADRSLDRSQGGLGLGLAVVKGLVELHGGVIQAASEGTGHGAQFAVSFPQEPELPALSSVAVARPPATQRLRILLVEDNEDAAESLRLLLELTGYEVWIASTGLAGVEAAQQQQPDVIICDIGLPGMDGYAVASALRQNPLTAASRLIAVTGYGQEEDRRRALAAGFDCHLVKPVEPERLLDQLARDTTQTVVSPSKAAR